MLRIRRITDPHEWDEFVSSLPFSPMTQAYAYGSFYGTMGEEFFIAGCYENEQLVGGALVIVIRAKRGSYFYLPYGPLARTHERFPEILHTITTHLVDEARVQKVSCIRISPFIDIQLGHDIHLPKLGYQKAPIHALAETTCLLDITRTEEELLARMNKNHRNLIRRCQKEGVTITSFTSHEQLAEFHKLHSFTAKKHHFVRFSDQYVEREFQAFEKEKQAVVFYAHLPDGTLDSGAVVYYYGTTAAYRHGASLGKNSKIPTPYLIQWSAIQEAKRRGMQWYNFWGIAPDNAKQNHPFKGITHFKKGFGGIVQELIECHDLIIDPWRYYPMRIFETIRKIKRGF